MDFRMGKPTFDDWNSEAARLAGPNPVTFAVSDFRSSYMKVSDPEYIGVRSKPGELKHLSTRRKGHQQRLR
jgi:hypothetical protein